MAGAFCRVGMWKLGLEVGPKLKATSVLDDYKEGLSRCLQAGTLVPNHSRFAMSMSTSVYIRMLAA